LRKAETTPQHGTPGGATVIEHNAFDTTQVENLGSIRSEKSLLGNLSSKAAKLRNTNALSFFNVNPRVIVL
jgi:hypothetical protein